MKFGRREFIEKMLLFTGSASLVGCGTNPLHQKQPKEIYQNSQHLKRNPATPSQQLEPEHFILHNPKPLALESIRAGIGMGALTSPIVYSFETTSQVQTNPS